MATTIQALAERLDAPVEEVMQAAQRLGIYFYPQPDYRIEDGEADDISYYFGDPTPHEQWRNTDGAPDTPWSED